MAEQNTDDTRPPAPRRGARPFAGPSGAPSAARPLLKPAGPANRPPHSPAAAFPATARAPFRIAVALPPGTAPAPVPLAQVDAEPPALAAAALQAEHVGTEPAGVPASATEAEPTWLDGSLGSTADVDAATHAEGEIASLDDFEGANTAWELDVTESDSADAGWQEDDGISPSAPLLDDLSLGSGADAQQLWDDDIALPDTSSERPSGSSLDVATTDASPGVRLGEGPEWVDPAPAPSKSEVPSWLGVDADAEIGTQSAAGDESARAGEPAAMDVNWADAPSIPSADAVIGEEPAATAALGEAMSTSGRAPEVSDSDALALGDADAWPGPLLAEYAPYVSAPPLAAPGFTGPADAAADALGTDVATDSSHSAQTVEGAPVVDTAADVALDAVLETGGHAPDEHPVSAMLVRLAERVRGGEIDVSSVAPDATDAALLASLLATLLGGSSSRR